MGPAARLLALGCAAFGLTAAQALAFERTYRIGPIPMGPYQSVYKTSFDIPHPRVPKGSLTYMHTQLVDAKGRFVPQEEVMIHHAAFVNRGRFDGEKSQFYCEEGHKERFYGTGEEDQSLLLPPGYGYRVRAKDRWHVSWMLMNHHNHARRVFIEYTLRMNRGWRDTPVTPHWIGVEPCLRDPIFNVPGGGGPGAEYVKAIDWRPPADGRIVAVGTHVHGGAKTMRITEPACGDRTLVESQAQYGLADDPIYHVLPQIHEPSPRFASYPMSATGIPVRKGRTYRATAIYDNELPHARVMGIMHAYVAPLGAGGSDSPRPAACAPLPDDLETVGWDKPFRTEVPKVEIPLAVRDRNGNAKPVRTLPGNFWRPGGDAIVRMENLRFNHRKVSIAAGDAITWIFADPFLHDVTSASGPSAIGSQPLKEGARWRLRFRRRGTYHLYCTLHPLDMQQVVEVR